MAQAAGGRSARRDASDLCVTGGLSTKFSILLYGGKTKLLSRFVRSGAGIRPWNMPKPTRGTCLLRLEKTGSNINTPRVYAIAPMLR